MLASARQRSPSERRPVLTRFGHASELDGAKHFTFLRRAGGRRRGGREVKRAELPVTDYITVGYRMQTNMHLMYYYIV